VRENWHLDFSGLSHRNFTPDKNLIPATSAFSTVKKFAHFAVSITKNSKLRTPRSAFERHPPSIHQSINPPIHQSNQSLSPVVRRALSRLVWRHVDRLHHRSENRLLRSEADLAPAYTDDGEPRPFIETILDSADNPYDNLVRQETNAEFEALRIHFRKFLGRERRLKSLFTCYENCIWRPRDIAARLHLSLAATRNLQKRLKRRLQQFLQQRSHAE